MYGLVLRSTSLSSQQHVSSLPSSSPASGPLLVNPHQLLLMSLQPSHIQSDLPGDHALHPSHISIRYAPTSSTTSGVTSASLPHQALLTFLSDKSLSTITESSNIHEAMQHSCWAAVKAKLDALVNNHTWSLVPLPRGRHPINCKWIFKVNLMVRLIAGRLDL